MQINHLGKTGLKVSELCLGAMTFGREATEAESFSMLDAFVAAGGNFIDTADVYSRGASEEILGRWLEQQDREDLVIATKVRWGTDEPANRRPQPLRPWAQAHRSRGGGKPKAPAHGLRRPVSSTSVGLAHAA